ncbi:hypothetical protein Taro_046152 [Colocasia esculenta]|uniref:Uncharacterized protein n=1 Tax=Colocasia esculenta TaxID=4460 RepID=A0A843WYL8_COLES|nr:hypothetical protein [Colocasia esculenta]
MSFACYGCLACSQFARCLALEGLSVVEAPDCCFRNMFLGAIHGGTGVCGSLTLWRVWGLGCFCLWALDLVESSCFRFSLEFLLLWLVRDWLSLLSLVHEAHPPYFLQLDVGRVAEAAAVAPCVVISSESECYELL